MHALRRSSLLARLALAWFALTLATAIASPIVHRQALELVCAEGSRPLLVVHGEDGSATRAVGQHALDCPLCLAALPPPVHAFALGSLPLPAARALPPMAPAPTALASGAPLPARGPPASFARS